MTILLFISLFIVILVAGHFTFKTKHIKRIILYILSIYFMQYKIIEYFLLYVIQNDPNVYILRIVDLIFILFSIGTFFNLPRLKMFSSIVGLLSSLCVLISNIFIHESIASWLPNKTVYWVEILSLYFLFYACLVSINESKIKKRDFINFYIGFVIISLSIVLIQYIFKGDSIFYEIISSFCLDRFWGPAIRPIHRILYYIVLTIFIVVYSFIFLLANRATTKNREITDEDWNS